MKKLAVVLVLVGVLTFCAVSTATAQIYPVTLCANGIATAHILATYIGTNSGKSVYALNGWVQNTDGLLSGTATIAGGAIHWGFTVHRTTFYSISEVWDFTTDFTFNGSGYYKTTDSALGDYLTITPGSCP